MKSSLLGAVSARLFTFTSMNTVQAAPVGGQGTWETTLEGRLETAPRSGVFLAYYDTVLDITWAAKLVGNQRPGGLDRAKAWASVRREERLPGTKQALGRIARTVLFRLT
jgi:hypothetical protein